MSQTTNFHCCHCIPFLFCPFFYCRRTHTHISFYLLTLNEKEMCASLREKKRKRKSCYYLIRLNCVSQDKKLWMLENWNKDTFMLWFHRWYHKDFIEHKILWGISKLQIRALFKTAKEFDWNLRLKYLFDLPELFIPHLMYMLKNVLDLFFFSLVSQQKSK